MSKAKLRVVVLGLLMLLAVGLSLMASGKDSGPILEKDDIIMLETVNQAIDEVVISLSIEGSED